MSNEPVKLTLEQANIISAYTGILCVGFTEFQKYCEEKLGRPILTHEFADKEVWRILKECTVEDFLSICHGRN